VTSTRERGRAAAARAAEALPEGGEGPGVARAHDRVEVADVDAELQRAGGDHAAHVAVAQALLDATARLREVAAAVGLERLVGDALGARRSRR
jgi:hypothetical protein